MYKNICSIDVAHVLEQKQCGTFIYLGGTFIYLGGTFIHLGGTFIYLGRTFVYLVGTFIYLGGTSSVLNLLECSASRFISFKDWGKFRS